MSEPKIDINEVYVNTVIDNEGVENNSDNGDYERIKCQATENERTKHIILTGSYPKGTSSATTSRWMKIVCFVHFVVFVITVATFSVLLSKLVSHHIYYCLISNTDYVK